MRRISLALLASLGLALQVLGAVGAAVTFRHGVSCARGSPESNTIYTWVTLEDLPEDPQTDRTVPLRWQVATAQTFAPDSLVASGDTHAAPVPGMQQHGNAVRAAVHVTGLSPLQRYFYRFTALLPDGPESPVGSFITPSDEPGETRHIAAHLDVDDSSATDGRHIIHSSGAEAAGAPHRRALGARSLQQADDGTLTFQLLHVNDMHNRIEAFQPSGSPCTQADESNPNIICLGGFARIASFVSQKRATGVPTIVLDAGDQSTGTLWDVLYTKHEPTARAQVQIGFDAMTLGQHEFDNGLQDLADYIDFLNSTTPVLGACNIETSPEPLMVPRVKKWIVKNIGGVKVGIIGYHTTDTSFQERAGKLRFQDPVAVMPVCVDAFKRANPDVKILIALSQGGYLVDQKVAAVTPGLDLIVGGHSHTFLYGATGLETGPLTNASNPKSGDTSMGPYPTYVTGPSGHQVPIVQASNWGKYMGALTLTFDTNGTLLSADGQPVLMGDTLSETSVPNDPAMVAMLDQYRPNVERLVSNSVGYLANALTGDRSVTRLQESGLGELVCDALLWHVKNTTTLSPQICLINAGTLRTGLDQGNVTSGELLNLLPFGDTVTIKDITGLALLTALENGLGSDFSINETKGAFPQVAGFRFAFNSSAPKNNRVLSVEVLQPDGSYQPLNLCATYRMVTQDYVGRGGDSYTSVKAAYTVYEKGVGLITAVAQYIRAFSPVTMYAAPLGRLNRCNPTGPNPAVCLQPRMASLFSGCPVNFTLLHYNDVHARIEAKKQQGEPCTDEENAAGLCFGGMARLEAAVKDIRNTNATTLLLDAGDVSVGSPWDLVYQDRRPMASIQNSMGVNAFTLGNHEFDYGIDNLYKYLSVLTSPVVVCNLDTSTLGNPSLAALIKKYTVVELGTTGVRAGIVGWIAPTTANLSTGAANVRFLPVLPAVRDAVAAIRADFAGRVNIIIGLSHGGYAADVEVATWVPDIDLIVSGHDHLFMYGTNGNETTPPLNASDPSSARKQDMPYPKVIRSAAAQGKMVPIVQAFWGLVYMGRLQVAFDPSGRLTSWAGQPELLGSTISSSNVREDDAALQTINALNAAVDTMATTTIGYSPAAYVYDKPAIRSREQPLGNLVCDAVRWYLNYSRLPYANFCLMNAGSIRGGLDQGPVTAKNVYDVLPYDGQITIITVTGAQVIQALENGVSNDLFSAAAISKNWRYPQVGGLRFWYNPSLPVGQRVLAAQEQTRTGAWIAIRPCGIYNLATTDYVLAGGDGYTMFKTARRVGDFDAPPYVALFRYVNASAAIPPVLGNRIKSCPGAVGCPATRTVIDTCKATFVPWGGSA